MIKRKLGSPIPSRIPILTTVLALGTKEWIENNFKFSLGNSPLLVTEIMKLNFRHS